MKKYWIFYIIVAILTIAMIVTKGFPSNLLMYSYNDAESGIKKTIKDYGIDEKDFLDRLDEMSEQAFDDQCTGANPRYPLISEIKDMYLKAYYGKE
mgnify:CR=1 FL=1